MPYPVLRITDSLKEKLRDHKIVILQAPPGAGKSTVLPLQLIDEPWLEGKKMVMLEPRRLAARSVAMRMSSMLQEETGTTVGYRVRFETKVTKGTRIEVVTEGILTRMIQQDNALQDIGLLIFDEFHERSLHADTALALALQVQQVLRPDLKILIMSATIAADELSAILENAPVVISEGKQFPVETFYSPVDGNGYLLDHVVRTIRKAQRDHAGDILVFLPGAGEIKRVEALLAKDNADTLIYPLFGDLAFNKQQAAILPDANGNRKIVLSTAIAETSLTIEGIGIVIDCGLSRVPRFNPRTGLTALETIKVTKDSADQRRGRAGRLGPGVCYRLWSEATDRHLQPSRSPEILESDLASLILELSEWGIQDVNELTWITIPPPGPVSQARELHQKLGALADGKITPRGKAMLRLPTHPRIAHMLMEATAIGDEVAITVATDLAALLEEKDPLEKEAGSDLSTRIELLRRWRSGVRVSADIATLERIERLAEAWRKILRIKSDNDVFPDTLVGRLLIEAYPERIAMQMEKHSNRYKLSNGKIAKLADHDPLIRTKWISIAALDAAQGEGKIFLAAPLDERDIEHIAEEKENISWDDHRQMITGAMDRKIGALTLSSKPFNARGSDRAIGVLLNVIRDKGLKFIGWDEREIEWQARILSLRHWRPGDGWPDVSDDSLLAGVDVWLAPFLTDITKGVELQKLNLPAILHNILPWELSAKLNQLAPQRLTVPSGSDIKINYFPDGKLPVMEVRLQEVFGLTETPTINEGRTRIVLHLLSPGYKPVQVTQDLRSFWNNTYAEVRKELRSRYPKHSWPDDPWTAEAVRGVRRKS